jgi:tetratricopeptide (TPR) repeat protein/CHAT domain-containing protein
VNRNIEREIEQLANEVDRLKQAEQLEAAAECASRLVDLSRTCWGANHEAVITALRTQASLHEDLTDFEAACSCYLQLLPVQRAVSGEQHPEVAATLHDIAFMYDITGENEEAKVYYHMALDLQRRVLPEDHPHIARTLHNLAIIYNDNKEHDIARSLHQEALQIRRKIYGNHHPEVASSLSDLGAVYSSQGDYSEAEALYQQAVDIGTEVFRNPHTEAFGHLHPQFYAADIYSLASLYYKQGKYHKAMQYYEMLVQVQQEILGDMDPELADDLARLAGAYEAVGKYAEAIQAYEQALKIRVELLGESDVIIATTLNSLASLYESVGEYAKALSYSRQALALRKQHVGSEHPDYARNLNNLAEIYLELGNYGASEQLFEQALKILRVDPGPDHPDFATGLNNLGLLYQATGRHSEAEAVLEQALEIRRAALSKGHPDIGTNLANLASVCHSQGLHSRAETLYLEAIEINLETLDPGHPLHATDLNNLGFLYCNMGRYGEAEKLLRRALAIWSATIGDNHPDRATALHNLAVVLTATDRTTEAAALLEESIAIEDALVSQIFSVGSDWQRLSYLQTLHTGLYTYISFVMQYGATLAGSIDKCFALVLRRKGIGAEVLAVQREALLGGRYPTLQAELRELVSLRREIARQLLAGPGTEEPALYHARQAQLAERREQLEEMLSQQVAETNLASQMQSVNPGALATHLNNGSALVEFVKWSARDFHAVPARGGKEWSAERYAAFVLRTTPEYSLQLVDLGVAETPDNLISTLRTTIGASESTRSVRDEPLARTAWDADAFLAVGNALRSALVDPLLPAIGECKRLFLAADGNLTHLPFEVLPLEGQRHLIDDYHISYLSTGRDLLRQGASFTSTRPSGVPVVAANPNFNLGEDLSTHSPANPSPHVDTERSAFGPMYFWDLPGSHVEGELLAKLLGVEPLLRDAVRKSTLKECHSPSILHLATHGFFLPEPKYEPVTDPEQRVTGKPVGEFLQLVNPLLRSGLALSGANTWLQGGTPPPEAEDGLLTAEEIMGMDLLGTQLVVLSACDTGLGHIQVGEGVFGLRRAFMLAGARTLVMSLWLVPDQSTQELMVSFYTAILSGRGCAEALRSAQLALKAKHQNPLYWSGFICEGDPSPILTATSRQQVGL